MTSSVLLTTERLILREYTQGDWQETLAYQSDPRYLQFYSWTGCTEAEVQEFVARFVAQQEEEPRRNFQLALTQKSGGRLLGSGGIRVHNAEERQANIGYELNPHFWGFGFAAEAAHELLRFGFEVLGMHRISAECVAENAASIRVMERNGMRREAHLRENTWFKDQWWDTLSYAVLEHEWHAKSSVSPLWVQE